MSYDRTSQGCNARKVISEVCASFTAVNRLWAVNKHSPDVKTLHGIHLSHKKSMKYYGHRKLLCELSQLSKFINALNLLGY